MRNLDWNAKAKQAADMSNESIHYALLDILATKESACGLDRADNGNRWGHYCDEASVLRAELKKRK